MAGTQKAGRREPALSVLHGGGARGCRHQNQVPVEPLHAGFVASFDKRPSLIGTCIHAPHRALPHLKGAPPD